MEVFFKQSRARFPTGTEIPTGNDANPETGAFARYIAVKGDLQMHIPDDVSFEAASTVGVGIGTVGYGLYHVLKLRYPGSEPKEHGETVLIYGGSTATGSLAIQFAKLRVFQMNKLACNSANGYRSGYNVVTTCSPHNSDYVKKLGADSVYDYVRKVPKPSVSLFSIQPKADHSNLHQASPRCGPRYFRSNWGLYQ